MNRDDHLTMLLLQEREKTKKLKNLLNQALPIIRSKSCVEFDSVNGRTFFHCKSCDAQGWSEVPFHKEGCSLGELIKEIEYETH